MPAYAAAIQRPPRTLTDIEQAALLRGTGEHRDGYRDHCIVAVALGTALREHEIAALNVGDVLYEDGRIRRRIALRTFKRSSIEPASQEVFVPDSLWYKLGKLVAWKRARGESLDPDAALFVSRRHDHIATRTLRYLFRRWQQRAGFDRLFNFHALRHSALTNLYRASRDIRLTQWAGPQQERGHDTVYASPSDEEGLDRRRSSAIVDEFASERGLTERGVVRLHRRRGGAHGHDA
jgi:integrase